MNVDEAVTLQTAELNELTNLDFSDILPDQHSRLNLSSAHLQITVACSTFLGREAATTAANFQMAAFTAVTAVTVPRLRRGFCILNMPQPTLAAPVVSTSHKAPAASKPEIFAQRLGLMGLGLLAGFHAARRPEGRVIVRGRNYEKNIRGKKGPAERKQAKITAKHLRMIVLAVKDGGPDPTTNSMLSRYIKAALKDNLPKDTIDRRIKAFTASSATEGQMG
eukprot:s777_g44.t1